MGNRLFSLLIWIQHLKKWSGTNFQNNSPNRFKDIGYSSQLWNSRWRPRAKIWAIWAKFQMVITFEPFGVERWNFAFFLFSIIWTTGENLVKIWDGGFHDCPCFIWNYPLCPTCLDNTLSDSYLLQWRWNKYFQEMRWIQVT